VHEIDYRLYLASGHGVSCRSLIPYSKARNGLWTPLAADRILHREALGVAYSWEETRSATWLSTIIRDEPNSRFHRCVIFHEISWLQWHTFTSTKYREIRLFYREFHFICEDIL